MRGWFRCVWWLLLLPVFTSCVHPFYASNSKHSLPVLEEVQSLDRKAFVHYLDSAAVDDWEGIWLLLGRDTYCYLAIERLNDYSHEARYTHRIMLWFDIAVLDLYTYEAGTVLGYLEQDLVTDVRRITLYDVSTWGGWVYPKVESTARLSDDRRAILFEKASRNKRSINQVGLKRIYPIRSEQEQEYRVRYL